MSAFDVQVDFAPVMPTGLNPTYLLLDEGKWYAAVALIEYDPNAPNITDPQRQGVHDVEQLFNANRSASIGVAKLTQRWEIVAQGTGGPVVISIRKPTPPPPPPGPAD